MSDPNAMTAEEYAQVIAAAEARLPVPMRHPLSGRVAPIYPANVPARLTAGWTYATTDRRAA